MTCFADAIRAWGFIMKRYFSATIAIIATLALSVLISACGGGGGGGSPPPQSPPPPPPPPPVTQNPGGLWFAQLVSMPAPDVFTSFEFNDNAGFTTGSAPYTATFSNGNAETRGILAFYISGLNAWHILVGTSATVTFETLPSTLSFWVRTVNATDVAQIQILDENGMLILNVVPTNAYQPLNAPITVVRGAGQTLIGSVVVTSTSGGDVVIDDWTFGYAAFAGSTDDLACLVADSMEFVCVVEDSIGDIVASAQGTLQITNGNQVSGSGTLYAAPGTVLGNGSTITALTVSAGTVTEGTALNFALDAGGGTASVSMLFDNDYNRGSALATIEAVYQTFDIYGDTSSFIIDASGVISGNSTSGCVLSGQVTIIDSAFNAYDVALGLANCGGLDGMYNGLGITQDDLGTDDQFAFVVFTAQNAIIATATQ